MEIRFQPALLQEVIDSFVEKTEREGDPTYYKEFHEYADPIYEKFILEDREGEFKKLYQYLFGTWGFSDIIRDSFNEYPLLKDRVGIVLVKGVLKEDQEGVDILRKWGSVEQELAKKRAELDAEEQKLRAQGIDHPMLAMFAQGRRMIDAAEASGRRCVEALMAPLTS